MTNQALPVMPPQGSTKHSRRTQKTVLCKFYLTVDSIGQKMKDLNLPSLHFSDVKENVKTAVIKLVVVEGKSSNNVVHLYPKMWIWMILLWKRKWKPNISQLHVLSLYKATESHIIFHIFFVLDFHITLLTYSIESHMRNFYSETFFSQIRSRSYKTLLFFVF